MRTTVRVKYETLVHETDKAYLLKISGHDIWVPKSRSSLRKDGRVEMPIWLAYAKQEQTEGLYFGLKESDIPRRRSIGRWMTRSGVFDTVFGSICDQYGDPCEWDDF